MGLGDRGLARSEQVHRTRMELEERVVELRLAKTHTAPKKLKRLLEDRDGSMSWLWESTIGEILKRHNLMRSRKRPREGVLRRACLRIDPGVVDRLQELVSTVSRRAAIDGAPMAATVSGYGR